MELTEVVVFVLVLYSFVTELFQPQIQIVDRTNEIAIAMLIRKRRRLRSLNKRTSAWWETVVPTYTDVQWIKDFRMSKHSFQYLCSRLEATLGRRDTNYRECVPVRKKSP
ncbi:Argininosuccinate lyase [Dissostichus eleginoides]|uniref:Argininosuccinate lyase n=1 Tax=Dissostichus eleginoides TaxID=100907 RepID=A0AAD9CMQ7_DISEL|nr:Argininosuccinate lyase [Dissostichus eleginoides]